MNNGRRSPAWFDSDTIDGFLHRSWLKTQGFTDESFRGRPIIGICNSWSELVNCNAHLRDLAGAVKRGVLQAGGFPLEFPVMSTGEALMKPTTMLYRNLMSMDIEESIRAYPLDGVVLLAGCDKTTPASLLGAASANIPSIVVTGGPMLNGHWRGESLGSCTDCWRLYGERRAGNLSRAEWVEVEGAISRSAGHCMTMGTASTMACITEALGMTLPGGAAIPAVDTRRSQLAERAGTRAVALVEEGLRPDRILTTAAFHNAIRILHATGGSTNGVLHLIALAGRVGVDLPMSLFDELGRSTPFLVNLKPSGTRLMEDLFHAGGLPAVIAELGELLEGDAVTVTGRTLRDNNQGAIVLDESVVTPVTRPLSSSGSLIVLNGNLCPSGAVMKISAAEPQLLEHEGPAVVFSGIEDLLARIDDPALEVTPDSVLVLQNAGPVGGPGMPEWGQLPIPRRLLQQGVTDMLRISDARMSGTSYGAVVLHVAPEAAVGGPLGLVRDGDRIRLAAHDRRLELLVDEAELGRRRALWEPPALGELDARGYRHLYQRDVLQADQGCDFGFLRGRSPVIEHTETYG